MASLSPQQQQELALSAAYEDDTPTPLGWRRKLIPHIGKGLVPARTDVIFIAPNREEFKTKAQLQRYLKSNKGSPSLSEFIWMTDETPRRSSRSVSKRSKSPPKFASKKKHVMEIPLEESKATKGKRIEKEDVIEKPKGDKSTHSKKTGKVAPIESKDDTDKALTSSSPASNAKDSKKKPIKDTKKKKGTQITTQSTEVSSNMHISANDKAHMSEKHENGNDEAMEENGNEKIVEENGEEENMEEPISHEPLKEVPMMTSIEIEEHVDGKEKVMDNVHDQHMDDQAGSKDVDGDCDGTTTSMLGSDLSAEGMEAESEIFESEKKERPLCEEDADRYVEKDENDNTPHDCAKDAMTHQENHLIEAAK